MRRADKERFHRSLMEKRDDLLGRVRAARSSETEGRGRQQPDLADRALNTVSRDLLYQLSGGERETLRRIDAALDRMNDGSYGECANCQKKVQVARLKAVPWARHCIQCQELHDRGEI